MSRKIKNHALPQPGDDPRVHTTNRLVSQSVDARRRLTRVGSTEERARDAIGSRSHARYLYLTRSHD